MSEGKWVGVGPQKRRAVCVHKKYEFTGTPVRGTRSEDAILRPFPYLFSSAAGKTKHSGTQSVAYFFLIDYPKYLRKIYKKLKF